ncbi:Cell cycle and apoptosis regulator protein 2 [Chlorella vulgaris]
MSGYGQGYGQQAYTNQQDQQQGQYGAQQGQYGYQAAQQQTGGAAGGYSGQAAYGTQVQTATGYGTQQQAGYGSSYAAQPQATATYQAGQYASAGQPAAQVGGGGTSAYTQQPQAASGTATGYSAGAYGAAAPASAATAGYGSYAAASTGASNAYGGVAAQQGSYGQAQAPAASAAYATPADPRRTSGTAAAPAQAQQYGYGSYAGQQQQPNGGSAAPSSATASTQYGQQAAVTGGYGGQATQQGGSSYGAAAGQQAAAYGSAASGYGTAVPAAAASTGYGAVPQQGAAAYGQQGAAAATGYSRAPAPAAAAAGGTYGSGYTSGPTPAAPSAAAAAPSAAAYGSGYRAGGGGYGGGAGRGGGGGTASGAGPYRRPGGFNSAAPAGQPGGGFGPPPSASSPFKGPPGGGAGAGGFSGPPGPRSGGPPAAYGQGPPPYKQRPIDRPPPRHHMPLSPVGGRGGGAHGPPPRDYRPRHLDLPGTSAGGGRDERRHAAAAAPPPPAARRHSPSPAALEARVVPYGVKLPAYSLAAGSAEYREVERRHSLLYMAHDFTKVVNCWVQEPACDTALAGRLLPLEQRVPLEHFVSAVKQDSTAGAAYDMDQRNVAPSGSVLYNAKVVFTTGLGEADRAALLAGAADKAGEHLGRLLKFVVARADRGGNKSGIFCLGGRCDPSMDGDPADGDAALIAAARRHVAAQVQLELPQAGEGDWQRFLEVHYMRLDRNDVEHHQEVTVVYLVDASRCLASIEDWPAVWRAQQRPAVQQRLAAEHAAKKQAAEAAAAADIKKKEEEEKKEDGAKDEEGTEKEGEAEGVKAEVKAEGEEAPAAAVPAEEDVLPEPEMPAQPQLQLVGLYTDKLKLKTSAISLDGLLDYNTSDKDECTFELSLFAEAFQQALLRDAGAAILAELYRQREAAVKRREERKRKRDAEKAEEAKKLKTSRAEDATGLAGGASEATMTAAAAPAAAVSGGSEGKDKAGAAAPVTAVAAGDVSGATSGSKTMRVLSKPELALAFRFLDKTGSGYILTDDLRRLLEGLGLALHHAVVKELCVNVADVSGKYKNERVHYMSLCETEVAAPPEPVADAPAAAADPAAAAVASEEAAVAASEGAAEVAEQAAVHGDGDVEMKEERQKEGDGKAAAADGAAEVAVEPEMADVAAEAAVSADGGAAGAEQEQAAPPADADADMADGDTPAADGSAAVETAAEEPEDAELAAEVAALDIEGLASREKLASLTVAQLSKYLQLHRLPTGGKKAEVVALGATSHLNVKVESGVFGRHKAGGSLKWNPFEKGISFVASDGRRADPEGLCNCRDAGVVAARTAKQECHPEKECVVPELNACPPCEPAAAAAAAQPNGSTAAPCSQAPIPTWRSSPHVVATDHKPGMSAIQMQKSIVSLGATSRSRRAVAKLLAGEPISVAFIGGSSTWGQGAWNVGMPDFPSIVFKWLRETFPGANHTLVNGAVPGTPSSYFALCSRWHVPADVDLVVVEFNVNDGAHPTVDPIRRAHERMLRKLLQYDNWPAVLELVLYRYPGQNLTECAMDKDVPAVYRYAYDDELAVLAQYYHTPLISTRSFVWDYLPETAVEPSSRTDDMRQLWGKEEGEIEVDHPSGVGHGWIADILIHWLQQTLDDVARNPITPEDEQDAQRSLNVPMYWGNWESRNNTCMMGVQVKELVTKADPAFKWTNEGTDKKPKWGYVSNKPGSSLRLTLNTNVTGRSMPDGTVSVAVAFLKSYQHMGWFEVVCEGGCSCEPLKRSGHLQQEFNVSQLHLGHMFVTVSEACKLRMTVLNETESGEHKFKLIGLIVSEAAGMMLQDSQEDLPLGIQFSQPTREGSQTGAAREDPDAPTNR